MFGTLRAMMRGLWMLILLFVTGCAAPLPYRPAVPADFAMEVRVPADGTPGRLFIVEPDRTLRAATGTTPQGDLYPPATRLLSLEEMQSLFRAVEASGLLEEGAEDEALAAGAYHVYVAAGGGRYELSTADPEPIRGLIAELDRLAWIEPSGTEPSGTEPSGTEPSGTEPSGTEPSGTKPGGR